MRVRHTTCRALRGATAASLLAGAVAGALVASPASAAVAPGHTLTVFPQRDFISAQGYAPGVYSVRLTHASGAVFFSDAITAADDPKTGGFDGLVEVNHPGGGCWVGATPDVQPGDLVQVINGPDAASPTAAVLDSTTAANVAVNTGVAVNGVTSPATGTLEVHGTAQDAAGAPLPVAEIEQRIVANKATFAVNGRRTLRATNAAGSDGTLSYDTVNNPTGVKWTATYQGLSPADVNLALGAEGRIIWLGPAAVGSEQTIYEASSAVVAGPQAPCAAPLEGTVAPPPTVTATAFTVTKSIYTRSTGQYRVDGTVSTGESVKVFLTDATGARTQLGPDVVGDATGAFSLRAPGPAPSGRTITAVDVNTGATLSGISLLLK